ncbi:MAG: DUF748 domain-containing protein [Desulforegulaceae bacterium]|nr:DUF748 domain-containing protein [Desulforegulaceae bacterium]
MSKKNKIGLVFAGLFIFYSVLGFLIIPIAAKYIAPGKLSEVLKRDVEIGQIRFNPFAFSFKIKNFKVYTKDKENVFAGFEEVYANLGVISSVLKFSPVISDFYLLSPEVYIEKNKNNEFNFSDLISEVEEEKLEEKKAEADEKIDEESKKEKNFDFLVTDLKIENGSFVFSDKSLDITHEIKKLDLLIPFISGFEKDKEVPVNIYVSAIADQAKIKLDLETKPFLNTLESKADLKITDVFIPFYHPYIKDHLNLVPKSGSIDLFLNANYEKQGNEDQVEAQIKFDLKDFWINEINNKKIGSINKLSIETNKIYPLKNIYSIKNVLIDSPELELELKNKVLNVLNLVKETGNNTNSVTKAEVKPDDEAKKLGQEKKQTSDDFVFLVDIDKFLLKKGKILFSDHDAPDVISGVLTEPVKNQISDLNIKLSGFSTKKDNSSDFSLNCLLNNKSDLGIKGSFGIDPLFAKIDSNFNKISIDYAKGYLPYIDEYVNLVPKSGSMDLFLNAHYQKQDNEDQVEVQAKLDLNDFLINEINDKKFASINKLSIETNKIYPLKNIYSIKTISMDSPEIELEQKNKLLNALNLIKETKNDTETANNAQINLSDEDNNIDQTTNQTLDDSFFLVDIDEFLVNKGKISFTDYDAPAVTSGISSGPIKNIVSGLDIKVLEFSTKKNNSSNFTLNCLLNEKSSLDIKGEFGIDPLFANIDSNLNNLYFDYANGYIPSDLKILIKNGKSDLSSKTALKIENEELKLSSQADLMVKDLNIIERESKKDFFKLDSFEIKNLDFNLLPMKLDIEEIIISGINQKVLKNKNGKFNFEEIFPEKKEDSEIGEEVEAGSQVKPQESKELFPINISKITLKDVGADYTDFTLAPYFSTNFIINSAHLKNLSTQTFEGADLFLEGKVDTTAPFKANGKINPLLDDLLVDLQISLRSLDLTHLTPYSGKYIGRAIEKGQLSLNLDYDIKNRKIKSRNKLLLDQFEFGRRIKSETAVNLPVGLAVSLLKDRKGEINLDIPVSGSLDDPKFKVRKAVAQALRNLVVKAVASPFSLVASIGGGGEKIRYIEFLSGLDEFDKESMERINSVEKILFERPALRLDIKGYCDLEKDREFLKEKEFELLLAKEKASLGFDSGSILEEKELLKVLNKVYYSVFKNKKKFDLELEDKEKIGLISELIKVSIEISNEDLRYLGSKRAARVKEYIVSLGRVNGSRLFVIETGNTSPKQVRGVSNSRVELDLK